MKCLLQLHWAPPAIMPPGPSQAATGREHATRELRPSCCVTSLRAKYPPQSNGSLRSCPDASGCVPAEHRLSAEAALRAAYFQEDPAPSPPEALAALVQKLLAQRQQEQQQHAAELEQLTSFLLGAGDGQGAGLQMPAGVLLPPGWPTQ